MPVLPSHEAQRSLVTLGDRRGKTTCDILRRAGGDSVYGGGADATVNTIAGTYFIDINPVLLPTENEASGALQVVSYYEVTFPRQADVRNSDRLAIPGWLPAWEASKTVGLEYRVVPTGEFGNEHFYGVVQAGTTGATEPNWDVAPDGRVTDGTVIWQELGLAFTLEVKGTDDKKTSDSQLRVRCEEIK